MTLGEKIKEARKKSGLTQEQFAEKICVSRQAVTKWEADKGTPDVENLKAISKLLNVSIDFLLNTDEKLTTLSIKEAINLDDYKKTANCRFKEDAVVLAKYPHAIEIRPLIKGKKMNKLESALDWIFGGTIFLYHNCFENLSKYYLVKLDNKSLLVNVTKEFITSDEINIKLVSKNKFVIGDCKYTLCTYILNKE